MASNAEKWGSDGEEMARARESAMARNESTYHDAWTEKRWGVVEMQFICVSFAPSLR